MGVRKAIGERQANAGSIAMKGLTLPAIVQLRSGGGFLNQFCNPK
jgi:hypothetical protein